MFSRTQALASFALASALVLGGTGIAYAAQDKPVVGTSECTLAVNRSPEVRAVDANVVAAQDRLDTESKAVPAVTPERLAALQLALSNTQDDARAIRTVVQGQLCAPGAEPEPTTTPKPAPETTSPPVTRTEAVTPPRETTVIPVPTTTSETTVIHTDDDGSNATTSGGQVSVVPQGSVDTGAAW